MNGNYVDQVLSNTMVQGSYNIVWDAADFSSGVYFIDMIVDNKVFTEKVLLIK